MCLRGFWKISAVRTITTTINEALLRFIAAQTGGLHVPFPNGRR